MRSRLALVAIVAVGALFSGTGATLALSGSLSASQVVEAQPNGSQQVLGQHGSQTAPSDTLSYAPAGKTSSSPETLPSTQGTPTTSTTPPVQASRQVAASSPGETLPLTGLAAIPILVIGLVMIIVGFVLGKRAREQRG